MVRGDAPSVVDWALQFVSGPINVDMFKGSAFDEYSSTLLYIDYIISSASGCVLFMYSSLRSIRLKINVCDIAAAASICLLSVLLVPLLLPPCCSFAYIPVAPG